MSLGKSPIKVNLLDGNTSKLEAGITLGSFIIGGMASMVFLDYGAVIIGINDALVVPDNVVEFVKNSGLALISFIIGNKVKDSV